MKLTKVTPLCLALLLLCYDALTVGQKAFLLGFFSVNLKKAMDASGEAGSEDDAVPVKEALEFFVFGEAVNSAVVSCG